LHEGVFKNDISQQTARYVIIARHQLEPPRHPPEFTTTKSSLDEAPEAGDTNSGDSDDNDHPGLTIAPEVV
jgi:hypothetical protein